MADGKEAPALPTPRKAKPGRKPKARGKASSSNAVDARWTLRGISGMTRSLAVEAAENRNMTVGGWVSEAIVRHFQADKDGPSVPALQTQADIADMAERLAVLEKEREEREKNQVSRLFRRIRPGPAGRTT